MLFVLSKVVKTTITVPKLKGSRCRVNLGKRMESHQDCCLTSYNRNISKMDKQKAEIIYLI